MTDQHQAQALHCAGHPDVSTPNLDEFAETAYRFDHAYCLAPVCVASRGSLITGLRPSAHGARLLCEALDDGIPTIAHHFARAGYRTAAIGRMHFVDESRRHGFRHRVNEDDFRATLSPDDLEQIRSCRRNTGSVDGAPSDLPARLWQDTYYADETIRFLQTARDTDQPFLLWSSYFNPHTPLTPMREYFDLYDPARLTLPDRRTDALRHGFEGHLIRARERGWYDQTEAALRRSLAGYYGNVSQVDACIGRVLSVLRQTGLDRDTIVVYTSDHGEMAGAHRMWTKHNMHEQSVNVPLLIRVPGTADTGTVCPHLISQVDLYPALAELCGLPAPTGVHGRSFAPLLTGGAYTARDAVVAQYDFCHKVFTKDDRYVGRDPIRMIRTQRWKLNELSWAKSELYDLQNDPAEHVNRVDDPGLADVVAELRARLSSAF